MSEQSEYRGRATIIRNDGTVVSSEDEVVLLKNLMDGSWSGRVARRSEAVDFTGATVVRLEDGNEGVLEMVKVSHTIDDEVTQLVEFIGDGPAPF